MNDRGGNALGILICNGARGFAREEREPNDYYATEPKAVELLLEKERFQDYVWECACGGGHIADVLKKHGYKVRCSDIIDRGYPETEIIDFLNTTGNSMDIITNPPYKIARQFVEHAMEISDDGVKVAMLLKLTFLESKARKVLFEKYPMKTLYVSSSRLQCVKNGAFEIYRNGLGSAVAYGWYVWEKGFYGEPVIRWM